MLKKLLFYTCLLSVCSILAQKEANIWYFGEYAGLDFNSGTPVALTDGQLVTQEGCATISDSNGNLLFYSDGSTVWNRNHQVMQNGTGLKGHPSSAHSALIVPKPNNSNIYYIFTVDQYGDPNGFRYSKIDLQLDGGLGGIVPAEKNIFMLPDLVTEKITAIKHTNDNDYWVVSHKFNSDEFVAFQISDSGINFTPIVSKAGVYVGDHFNRTIGTMKISPNGKKIACANGAYDGYFELEVFDFDTSSIENTILNGQTGMEVYYFNEQDEALSSPLPNPFFSDTQTIRAEVTNPKNNNCTASTDIEFIVNPLPGFSIDTPQIVCSSDPTFTVVLDPLELNTNEVFSYQWVYEDGTVLSNTPTLTVSTPGTYSLTLSKTDGTGCSRTRDIFVNTSELASITQEDINVIDVSNHNTITVDTANLGLGDYEFSLDDEYGNYQDESYFEDVPSGVYTVYVRDKKGCGVSSIDVSVVGFPKYFTPNGDGVNDYWQIDGANGQMQAKSAIYIYNRYGKLLKQLVASSKGWDGAVNGKRLTSDDYWFRVFLEDGREFKGHFTLKR